MRKPRKAKAADKGIGKAGVSGVKYSRPALRMPRPGGRTYRRNIVASSFLDPSRRSVGSSFAYTAAESRRSMESLSVTSGSANADLSYDLPRIRERCRALVRNNSLARGAIRTTVLNAIGTGLQLQSCIDFEFLGLSRDQATAWQNQAERLWRWWSSSKTCDVGGRYTFEQMQALVEWSTLENGDCFVLRGKSKRPGPISLALQLIEADRVSTPTTSTEGKANEFGGYMTHGVDVDETGAPARYWISDRHPGDPALVASVLKWKPVPARGENSGEWLVLPQGDYDRIDQARGVPLLTPCVEEFHQIKEFARIELQRNAVASLFTAFIKTPQGAGLGYEEESDRDDSHPEDYRMGSGAILDLAEGEDVVLADPKSQGAAFDQFVTAILRHIGPGVGIPLEMLTMHFQSSYSAARAARLEAWSMFQSRREARALQLCQPTYAAFLDEAVASGRLEAPGYFEDELIRAAYQRAEWNGPAMGQLDPLKEVQAAQARVALEISTLKEETAQITGKDWDAVHAQRVVETQAQKRDGLDVEAVAERIRTEPQAPEDPDGDDATEDAENEAMRPEPPKRKRQARRART